jgi:hypothetical protein
MRGLFFIGFVCMLVVSGCSRKVTSNTTTTETFDSTHVENKPRLVPIELPGETAHAAGKVMLDSSGSFIPVHIEGKKENAFVDVTIDKKGNVTAKGGCDSLKTVVEAMDKEIFRLKKVNNNKIITVTLTKKVKVKVPVYRTRDIDIFCRWYFGITLFIVGLVVFLKFKRFMP